MAIPGVTEVATQDLFDDYYIPKFGGNVWYCDGGVAASGDGKIPSAPFQTITEAIAVAVAGDAISVKQGTYDEAGLDLALSGMELWLEAGVILQDSADGTVLTISGFGCKVTGSGNVRLDPTGGATGVDVTGNFAYIERLRINCNSVGALGFDITGDGSWIIECRCANPTTAAFKVQGEKTLLWDCCTGGNAATIRFWVTNSCDKARLRSCDSQGHATAGFQVDSGCTNGCIIRSSSGGGDGERIDDGSLFHWPGFNGIAGKEQHYHCYPTPDGEGTAGDPINVVTDAADETNGAATTANYWGEPKVIMPVVTVTVLWSWFGINFFADTANKIIDVEWLRVNYLQSSAKNGGNAWDEGATQLTVADGSIFQTNDLVWIYSTYKTDGEIVKVSDAAGDVVTVVREASQFGAANTGLRWDHTTNAPGTEKMYRVYRSTKWGSHQTNIQVSFANAKHSSHTLFPQLRQLNANDGLVARACNMTDGTNGTAVDTSIVWREGAT